MSATWFHFSGEGIFHSSKTADRSRIAFRRLIGRVVGVKMVRPVVDSRFVGRVVRTVRAHLIRVMIGIGAALTAAAAATTALSFARLTHSFLGLVNKVRIHIVLAIELLYPFIQWVDGHDHHTIFFVKTIQILEQIECNFFCIFLVEVRVCHCVYWNF